MPKNNPFRRLGAASLLIPLSLWLGGCVATGPVKHLSSDVCLVMPESTTKSEVASFLGEPDKKTTSPEGAEIWLYYKETKDLLRTMPLVGEKIGSQEFEIVTVSFVGDKVRTCIYRQLTPAEFSSFKQEHQIKIPE